MMARPRGMVQALRSIRVFPIRALARWAMVGSFSALAAGLGACGAAQGPSKDDGRCDPDHPCEEGKVCIPFKLGGTRGRCAKQCKDDQACPEGARCSGRYQKIGTVERFCRQSVGTVGASCEAPLVGCRQGLGCFGGKCQRECKKDDHCPEIAHRCLPVTVDSVLEKDSVEVFRACLPAVEGEGKACKAEGPFCGRGLLCHNEKCTRACAKDADCPKDHVCDGGLYVGKDREDRAKQRKPPDLRYCRQGAKKGRPCHHNLDVGCAAGLSCIKFRCREPRNVGLGKRCDPEKGFFCEAGLLCHASACRKPCLEDSDCADAAGAPGTAPSDGAAPTRAAEAPAARSVASPRRGRRRGRGRHRTRRAERRAQPPQGPRCQEVLFMGQAQKVCM